VKKNLYISVGIWLFGTVLLFGVLLSFIYYRTDYNIKNFMLYESKYLDFKYTNDYISLSNKINSSDEFGLIFCPGAFIKEEAYLPVLSELSKQGMKVYLLKYGHNFDMFNIGNINKILSSSDIKNYILVGHSFGGSKILNYLKQNGSNLIKCVVLLSSYGTNSQDFSDSNIKFLSIVGSEDKIINFKKYENYKNNLPSTTKYVYIEGGNHSYFGNYGLQFGDSVGSISKERQQFIVINEILKLVEEI